MKLDLSKLLNMPTEATESHRNGKDGGGGTSHPTETSGTRGNTAGDTGIKQLQREIDQKTNEKQKALMVYQEYQKNIKLSSQLQSEIMKGLQSGEDIYTLFLKAMQIVSLTTSNKAQYNITEQYIREIYGYGLGNPAPLEIELQLVKDRLNRLEQAKANGMEHTESITRAIRSHRNKIKEIEALIAKGQDASA